MSSVVVKLNLLSKGPKASLYVKYIIESSS